MNIEKILKQPKQKSLLSKLVRLQNKVRFHTIAATDLSEVSQPATEFLHWVQTLLPQDKFQIFTQLFRFPLVSTSVVVEAYRELERVFISRNASVSYKFANAKLELDWREYKKRFDNVWHEQGWVQFQQSPNSILIVDATQDATDKAEPYFYWLDIAQVIDFSSLDGIHFDWLLFKQEGNKVAYFDQEAIRIYEVDEKQNARLISEAYHNLGFTPARFFIETGNGVIKTNPVLKEIANLEWYLFFALSKRHLDLYAPYPIYSAYESKCDYEDEAGHYCDGGVLRQADGNYLINGLGTVACPACQQRRLVGAGSFVEIPIPNPIEGVADMREPLQITTIDKESLDYNVAEVERLEKKLLTSMIGSGGKIGDREALNETQVQANFESRTAVLNAIKTDFEQAQRFVERTICIWRYREAFKDLNISWGTEFYLLSAQELYVKLEQARLAGVASAEIDAIGEQILQVEFKHNPLVLRRQKMLRALEPYRNLSLTEIISLNSLGMIDLTLLQIKLNLPSFVDRFEREFGRLEEFTIDLINTQFLLWAKEQTLTRQSTEFQ